LLTKRPQEKSLSADGHPVAGKFFPKIAFALSNQAMRIVLATFGSRGDVQPMLALSLALKSEGHAVLLAAPPEKANWAKRLGCPFHPLGSNVTAFIDAMSDAHSLRPAMRFLKYIRSEIKAQFDLLPKIVDGADLVIASSLVFALPTVAEHMGIEYRYIAFTPQLLPSSFHPFPAFKHQRLPKWYNRLTWRIAKLLDPFNLTRLLNNRREQLGLKAIEDAWLHILGEDVLVASDAVIAAVPADAELTCIQTGYLHLAQPHRPSPKLEAYLKDGPAPVYAGFGSMPKRDQVRNVPLIVAAARLCGQRLVIGKFWDEPSEFSNAEDIFFIKDYPHLRLFPQMAAVIHHGGAGTTASSAISGVPQVVVPHVLDQYYWGNQVYQTGLGPKPIWRSELTLKKLADAIRECLSNEGIRQKAQQSAGMINKQNSLNLAVREILKSRN
jgi:UDP:flavonoid glycosyltransferase YjiC (YdhE family)